jgi:hypothetical protein
MISKSLALLMAPSNEQIPISPRPGGLAYIALFEECQPSDQTDLN